MHKAVLERYPFLYACCKLQGQGLLHTFTLTTFIILCNDQFGLQAMLRMVIIYILTLTITTMATVKLNEGYFYIRIGSKTQLSERAGSFDLENFCPIC